MAGSAQAWVQGNVAANGTAILTLDRPKALNAMNVDMDLIYKKYLEDWATNQDVHAVLVESSSSRAFSAGMDVKGVAATIQEDVSTPVVHKVFNAEYSLICAIACYQKPYISFMDGITMGFGIGLSGHGRYRIITERTVLAMPENAIGLFPDVGFAHLVARSPGHGAVGAYLAMTGARISNPADALFLGLGTHYVSSERLSSLREALLSKNLASNAWEEVESLLTEYSTEPGMQPSLKNLLPAIIACFGAQLSVGESIEALKQHQLSADPGVAEWAKGALAGLAKGAPFSLFVTKHHYSAVAAAVSTPGHALAQVEGVMRAEFRLGVRTSTRPDFVEGVRAVLVDKDQKPQWKPARVEDVAIGDVAALFRPFASEADELTI